MQKTEYFYREYKSSSFEKSEKRKTLCFVIPKDDYHEKPLLWNAKTQTFKQIESEKEAELCSPSKNCVVELPEYEKIKKETFSFGGKFSSAFANLFQKKISSAEVLAKSAADFSSKNFASFISSEYKRKKNDYYNARKIDKSGIPRKDFAYEFKIDYEKLTLKFSIFSINVNPNEKSESSSTSVESAKSIKQSSIYIKHFYLFDIGRGFVKNSDTKLNARSFNSVFASQFSMKFTKERFPKNIVQEIINIVTDLACRFAGKKVVKPINVEKHNWQWIPCYLLSIVYLPFSWPLASNLIFSSMELRKNVYEKFHVDRKDANIFNHFMDFAKLPNIKSVRKVCLERGDVINLLYKLKAAGFTDLNCYNLAMKTKNLFGVFHERVEYEERNTQNLKFFFDYARKTRSEIAIMKTLVKINDDEVGSPYTDGLNMFRLYFDHIPEILKKRILRYGFTEKNHDKLSLLGASLKNVPFEYSEEQLSLEQRIEDYEFALPKDSTQLVEIGIRLHNCVASYSDDVIGKKCTIVYAKKNGKYELCIEVRGKNVYQERADSNFDPNKEQNRILRIWHETHGLEFTENKF